MANEFGPNMLDIHGLGANRPSYGVAWNCYDRLMSHGVKTLPDGTAAETTFVLQDGRWRALERQT